MTRDAAPDSATLPSGEGPGPSPSLDELLDARRDQLKELFPAPAPRPPRRTVARAAAAAAVVLFVMMGLWGVDPVWRQEQHATGFGERRELSLPDGSRLTLDSATRVRVNWRLRSRQVVLDHGRARFDVAHDWRPFMVAAQPARVEVVGTLFDVDRIVGRKQTTQVTVRRGRVHVWPEDGVDRETVVLNPGERIEFTRTDAGVTGGEVRAAADDRTDAWTQGQLVFQRTPLAEALAEVQRYRKAQIRVEAGETSRLEVSGVFDSAQADRFLELLPRVLPVKVLRNADDSVDIRAR